MANVPGTFYTAETQRRGTTPVSPPSAVDDPIDPVNPSGPPVVPPVAERYASEAAMIADQLNQKSGYLYFDGTDTWWYLGTTNGDITDYEAFGGGSGATTFLALTDTPSSYSGQANKWNRVNGGETALVFDTVSPYDLDQEGATDGQVLAWVAANSRYEPVTPSGGGISGLTTNKLTKATSATTIGDSIITEESSISILYGSRSVTSSTTPQKVSFGGSFGTNAVGNAGNLKWSLYDNGTASDNYGIGISSNLMEIRAGTNGAIGFFPNNGIEAVRVFVDGSLRMTANNFIYVDKLVTRSLTRIESSSPIYIQPSSGLGYLSLGTSLGGAAAGSSTNQKIRIFDNGTASSYYGIGMSASPGMIELQAGSNGNIGFFVNNGIEYMRILSTGILQFADAKNISFNTTTGTKIGTATTQKLSFWNKTPIIQPTNAIAAAAFVANTSGIADDTATFGGYTIGQIAAALINTGILA